MRERMVELRSASGRGLVIRGVARDRSGAWSCGCPGYRFTREPCRHFKIANEAVAASLARAKCGDPGEPG